jgi:hypothetical protein
MRRSVLVLTAVAVLLPGQQIRTGPEPGQPVPDFSLPDQGGKLRDLKSVMGPKGAVLVFYRSADW